MCNVVNNERKKWYMPSGEWNWLLRENINILEANLCLHFHKYVPFSGISSKTIITYLIKL